MKAVAIHEELKDRFEMARDYSVIGNVLNAMNKFEDALVYYVKALGIDEELNYTVGIESDCANVDLTLQNMEENEEALESVSKALTILQEIDKKTEYDYTLIERLQYTQNFITQNIENKGKRIKYYTSDGKPVCL